MILALGVTLFVGSVTIAVLSPYFLLAAALFVVQFLLISKFMGRHISAEGEAVLTDDALEIEPRRRAICASQEGIRIQWREVVSANMGPPIYNKKPLMILTTSTNPKRLRITVSPDGNPEFLHDLLERAEAWRVAHPAWPSLRREDPFSGPWWRGLGWLGIAGFAALIFGLFYYDKASDWSSWLRVLWLGSMLFPLLNRVFQPMVQPLDERAVQIFSALAVAENRLES